MVDEAEGETFCTGFFLSGGQGVVSGTGLPFLPFEPGLNL